MFRGLILLLAGALLVSAATVRLYLKDGEYQLASEYKVLGDRVRYYSTERGAWEEIPLDLVDLKRTESEMKQREKSIQQDAAAMAAEEKAEREARREVERVPVEPGLYLIQGDQLKTIPLAESKVVNNKRRNILKAISPIPIVSGKGTLEMDGPHSPNVVDGNRPEFYMRLSAERRFGLLRVGEHDGNRVVEKFDVLPVTKEIVEQQDEVEVFRHQVGDGLYKIWPTKPLEPGEYAMVEFTPATDGSINILVYDFGVRK